MTLSFLVQLQFIIKFDIWWVVSMDGLHMLLLWMIEPTFWVYLGRVLVNGLLKVFILWLEYCFKMIFLSRRSNDRGANRGSGNNWQRGHIRPRFSIHFDADPQELNQLFQVGFFNLVGQGILQPRPERPPYQSHQNFSGVCVPLMFLSSQSHLWMVAGNKLSIILLHIIMVGLHDHYHFPLLHLHSTQIPKLIVLPR